MFKIVKKDQLAANMKRFELEAPLIANKYRAGQFIVLRIDEKGERIPLTVADCDRKTGTITLVFQEVGKTTLQLGKMNKGDCILDVVGPLGNPSEIERFGTVICIGGGTGIACIYPIAKELKKKGNRIISIIGARTKELLIYENELREVSDELIVTTDDGSYGMKGVVTDPLKEIVKKEKIDRVVAIGPPIMMMFVCKTTKIYGIKTIVSLNPIMVDATGMCGACRVSVGGKTRFGCVDGPEFDGHEVDFELLMARLNQYKEEEKIALDNYKR
jgi:ferredoxin--NADP+ reductase